MEFRALRCQFAGKHAAKRTARTGLTFSAPGVIISVNHLRKRYAAEKQTEVFFLSPDASAPMLPESLHICKRQQIAVLPGGFLHETFFA